MKLIKEVAENKSSDQKIDIVENESMKPWLKRRRNFGFFETLLAEVRLEDVIEL